MKAANFVGAIAAILFLAIAGMIIMLLGGKIWY